MASEQDMNAVRGVNETRSESNFRLQRHNPLLNIRDRLFYALFCRVGLFYVHSVPRQLQRTLEFVLLFEALVALMMLTYVHVVFVREPVNCLQHVQDVWPQDGVLRVEIIKNASQNYFLIDSYRKHAENLQMEESDFDGDSREVLEAFDADNLLTMKYREDDDVGKNETSFSQLVSSIFHPFFSHLKRMAKMFIHEETYIVEYSLEYGFLRMPPATRNRLNLSVMLVVLDPTKDECFGGWFSQMLLEEFLGYEDILLSSLQQLTKKQKNTGFFRNVWSGEHYRFIEVSVSRISYIVAAFLMVFFTLSISMLLRYAHQQIFLFIVDLLQVFDRNALVTFPVAPLLTAVLALIGVEALMSELFIEASTAFYVILIVWLADQYDVICCHTSISRRHWLRFFYLYHFVFYAYHYRFNGHFSSITLATSWLFIQHSMVYFFHHYELPAIVHQARVQRLLFQAQHHQDLGFQADRTADGGRQERSPSDSTTVVAVLPESLTENRPASEDNINLVPGTVVQGGGREGQEEGRGNWSLFDLPRFRMSNYLIMARVFIQRPQEEHVPRTSVRTSSSSETTTTTSSSSVERSNDEDLNVAAAADDDDDDDDDDANEPRTSVRTSSSETTTTTSSSSSFVERSNNEDLNADETAAAADDDDDDDEDANDDEEDSRIDREIDDIEHYAVENEAEILQKSPSSEQVSFEEKCETESESNNAAEDAVVVTNEIETRNHESQRTDPPPLSIIRQNHR